VLFNNEVYFAINFFMLSTAPTTFEMALWQQNIQHVVGIDEVGRGAWAGPLVIGAVIFPPYFQTDLPINDSKKLTPTLRRQLSKQIKALAIAAAIFEVDVNTINSLGISAATQFGYSQVLKILAPSPQHILIDAFRIQDQPSNFQTPIIRGDSLSLSIAAASIIAKVYRDEIMQNLDEIKYPYSFRQNVGYGTKKHQSALAAYGPSDLHRTSFNLNKWISNNAQA
jgi:ribonuclease HII